MLTFFNSVQGPTQIKVGGLGSPQHVNGAALAQLVSK